PAPGAKAPPGHPTHWLRLPPAPLGSSHTQLSPPHSAAQLLATLACALVVPNGGTIAAHHIPAAPRADNAAGSNTSWRGIAPGGCATRCAGDLVRNGASPKHPA